MCLCSAIIRCVPFVHCLKAPKHKAFSTTLLLLKHSCCPTGLQSKKLQVPIACCPGTVKSFSTGFLNLQESIVRFEGGVPVPQCLHLTALSRGTPLLYPPASLSHARLRVLLLLCNGGGHSFLQSKKALTGSCILSDGHDSNLFTPVLKD